MKQIYLRDLVGEGDDFFVAGDVNDAEGDNNVDGVMEAGGGENASLPTEISNSSSKASFPVSCLQTKCYM